MRYESNLIEMLEEELEESDDREDDLLDKDDIDEENISEESELFADESESVDLIRNFLGFFLAFWVFKLIRLRQANKLLQAVFTFFE